MAELPNVYDSLTEAHFRLLRTTVMYDSTPYSVIAITDHREDKVFRIYLQPISWDGKSQRPYPHFLGGYVHQSENSQIGPEMDKWLETDDGRKSGIIRKSMDSKYFNKFRPFPLGMCNHGSQTLYIEWSPLRSQHQGLTPNAIVQEPVSLSANKLSNHVDLHSPDFFDCIQGNHPSAFDCLDNLRDPSVTNDAHAFNRRFALVRGPVDMLFLAYKTDIIGVLPHLDFSKVRLGKQFGYCKEVVAELNLFGDIITIEH